MFFVVRWLPTLVSAAGIFWLSSQSQPPGASLAPDYVGHFLVYAALTASLVWGWTNRFTNRLSQAGLFAVVAMAAIYGASDEFHQSFVPLRELSGKDLLFDFLAAAATAGALYRFLRRREES